MKGMGKIKQFLHAYGLKTKTYKPAVVTSRDEELKTKDLHPNLAEQVGQSDMPLEYPTKHILQKKFTKTFLIKQLHFGVSY